MIIDIVKKSTNSKLLKFFFHYILKINFGKLIYQGYLYLNLII